MSTDATTLLSTSTLDAIRRNGETARGYLIHLYPPGQGTWLLPVANRPLLLGRDPGCDLELADTGVSREHARLEPNTEGVLLVDLNSTNGTYLNDAPITRHRLDSGDRIRVGNQIFKFLASDDLEAQYHETIYALMIDDVLTGVRNKRYLLETLERELSRSRRHERPLSLVFFDLDHFKEVNDEFGHLTGDDLLRELCRRVSATVRLEEVFARFGGEEFAIVLPEVRGPEAVRFGERVRALVADKAFDLPGATVRITVSVGVASTEGDEILSVADFMRRADEKLYDAKRGGRNRLAY
ncbi:MAG: GGDEF domain-containing protein [Pirellulales bacterium]